MRPLIDLVNTLLPMLYAVATMNYSIDFFREDPFAKRMNRPLLGTVVGLHALYVVLRTLMYGHIPLASPAEVLTMVALAVALVYVVIELSMDNQKTGMFVLAFSFAIQTLASAFMRDTYEIPEVLRSPLFGVHTTSAVIGYTACAVSAIYGVLYLLLYHDLKSSRFGIVYQRLPSLDILARMSLRATVLGTIFLTVTIVIGALWASERFPGFTTDPKFVSTVAVWLVYATGIGFHYALNWGGRRTIYVSLAGFALMVASAIAVKYWLPTFHGFA